jgi:hypothetical protein
MNATCGKGWGQRCPASKGVKCRCHSAMVMQPRLLLTYKIPPEPSKKRVAIWRRLKGMGAVYLQSGVCLLPKTDEHVRRLKMLENDITGMGGAAVSAPTAG